MGDGDWGWGWGLGLGIWGVISRYRREGRQRAFPPADPAREHDNRITATMTTSGPGWVFGARNQADEEIFAS